MNRPTSLPERNAMAVAWIAIVLGAAARVWALSQRGSLSLDEASLALNVLTRSLGGLLQPLDWGQAAPVGFLWIQRLLASLADVPDPWLRVVPWCAGAVLPWLLWRLGRRMVGTGAGALAAVAAAGSLLAMRYSTDALPYAMDAGVAAALMLLATAVTESPAVPRRWWALSAGALVALVLSTPAVFVVTSVGVAIACERASRAASGARRVALPALGMAVALLAALWFVAGWPGVSGANVRDDWAPALLDFAGGYRGRGVVGVLMELTWLPLRWTDSLPGTAVGTALWIGGLVVVGRRRRSDAMLLGGPVLLAAVASVLGAYPFAGRLAFFAVPGVWVAQAAAVIGIRNALFSHRSVMATVRTAAVFVVVVACGIAAWQGTDSERFLRDPGAQEPTRALFAKVDDDAAASPIYVFARAVPAWLLATRDDTNQARLRRWTALAGRQDAPGYENASRPSAVRPGEGDSLVITSGTRTELVGLAPGVQYRAAGEGAPRVASPGWAEEEARRLVAAARPEVWLVASHFFAGSSRNELRPLVEAAAAAGLRVVEERHAGTDVLALRLSR